MEVFLLDAIEANNIDIIRASVAEGPKFGEQLLRKAITSAPREMLELLLDAHDVSELKRKPLLHWTVEADNLEATKTLLDRGFYELNPSHFPCIEYAFRNISPDMIELVLQYPQAFVQVSPQLSHFYQLIPSEFKPELEVRAIKCLDLMRSLGNDKNYKPSMEECFKSNAKRCCSVAIAEWLLKIGVNINCCSRFETYLSSETATALYLAAQKKTQRAAELMKFLLESGADPTILRNGAKGSLSHRPGPANISKWLGISWDELVEKSQKVYAASKQKAASLE